MTRHPRSLQCLDTSLLHSGQTVHWQPSLLIHQENSSRTSEHTDVLHESIFVLNGIYARPIEACVILLPVFEFLHSSPVFRKSFLDSLVVVEDKTPQRTPPFPYTILTLSSYLLTHATSLSSPRAIAYANLSLSILLVMVEHVEIVRTLCQSSPTDIRLCRQVCRCGSQNVLCTDARTSEATHVAA